MGLFNISIFSKILSLKYFVVIIEKDEIKIKFPVMLILTLIGIIVFLSFIFYYLLGFS